MANKPRVRGPKKRNEPEDAFIARVLEFTAWAKQNVRTLVIGGGALLLAVAGTLYYVNFQNQLREQAANRLAEIRQTAGEGNAPLAVRDLEGFVERFDGTPAAEEGRLLLAQLYVEQGEPAQAVPVVEPVAEDLAGPLGVPAAVLLAAAHEASEQYDRAESVYLRIADNARFEFQRRDALAAAARLRARQGDDAGAAELYERLVGMTSTDDPQHGLYQMRLAEARAAAGSAAGAAAGGE